MKTNLLVSFSGGETSAFMAQWLWKHKRDEYNMVFVFANTGQENQETIDFVRKCSEYFGFDVVCIEAKVEAGRKGTGYNVVPVQKLNMNGKPFESVIAKYGIPNVNSPHCTRELKERPIAAYATDLFGDAYYTAIGIREDEFDRISPSKKERKLLYPLISWVPMTKQKINFFWSQQPFRLQLKGYEGNCKTCWKKSRAKLYQIAKEDPQRFGFMAQMEKKYEYFTPSSRIALITARGEKPKAPYRFFRGNKTVADILSEAQTWDGSVTDDTQDLNFQLNIDLDGESCEVFSECSN